MTGSRHQRCLATRRQEPCGDCDHRCQYRDPSAHHTAENDDRSLLRRCDVFSNEGKIGGVDLLIGINFSVQRLMDILNFGVQRLMDILNFGVHFVIKMLDVFAHQLNIFLYKVNIFFHKFNVRLLRNVGRRNRVNNFNRGLRLVLRQACGCEFSCFCQRIHSNFCHVILLKVNHDQVCGILRRQMQVLVLIVIISLINSASQSLAQTRETQRSLRPDILRWKTNQHGDDACTDGKQGNHNSNQADFTLCRFNVAFGHISTKTFKGGVHALNRCFGFGMFGVHPLLQDSYCFFQFTLIRHIIHQFTRYVDDILTAPSRGRHTLQHHASRWETYFVAVCRGSLFDIYHRTQRLARASIVAVPLSFTFATAHSQPMGARLSNPDVRSTLGDCPAQLLRQAWAEMLPLETAAVEREVLTLCTERAETIAQFLRAQDRLNTALAIAQSPDVSGIDTLSDQKLANLRDEVAQLRGRIVRLEDSPEQPETEATLSRLREQLREAETDLRRAESARNIIPREPMRPSETADELPKNTAGEDDPDITPSRSVDPRPPTLLPPEVSDDGVRRLPESTDKPSPLDPDCTPPTVSLLYAVRRHNDDWKIALQESHEISVRIPRSPEEPNAGPLSEPDDAFDVVCQLQVDPPRHVTLNDILPSGWMVKSVTASGVKITNPNDDDAVQLLPFAGESSHGELSWDFHAVKDDG